MDEDLEPVDSNTEILGNKDREAIGALSEDKAPGKQDESSCMASGITNKEIENETELDKTLNVYEICQSEDKSSSCDKRAKDNNQSPADNEIIEPETSIKEADDDARELKKSVGQRVDATVECLSKEVAKDGVQMKMGEEEKQEEEGKKAWSKQSSERERGGSMILEEGHESRLMESEGVAESEARKSEDGKSDSECTSLDVDYPNKEASSADKQCVEPENTEFVQISQDKQEDAGNESQSIEAEDPFGGEDNLLTGEPVDSPTTDNIDFHKLAEQAVNLQDAVNNAKDEQRVSHFVTEDSNSEDVVLQARATNSESNKAAAAAADTTSKPVQTSQKSHSIESAQEEEEEDNTTEPMETDESHQQQQQSNVLPGQDDELCIIPDSMKETRIVTDKDKQDGSATANDNNKGSDDDNKCQRDKEEEEKKEEEEDKEEKEKTTTMLEKESDKSLLTKELEIISNPEEEEPITTTIIESCSSSSISSSSSKMKNKEEGCCSTGADVIDIEEDAKNNDEMDEITSNDETCKQCNEKKPCSLRVKIGAESYSVCSLKCKLVFSGENDKSMDIPSDGVNSKRDKRCASCLLIVEASDDRSLSWETMEFCNEECLGKFQMKYGSYCRNCNGSVQAISLGKYCVRFGYDVRQFCCSSCLEEFKKGLKVCSYCQKDISSGTEGFLAPVGDKGLFKDFCTQYCMEKYSRMNSSEPPPAERKSCSVCQEVKVVHCEVQIDRAQPVAICSDPCFAAFKFVNKVDPEQCSTCQKFFELANKKSFVVFYEAGAHTFCSKTCLNIFIITNRKIVPCNWCKVKKYNFDMIKKHLKTGQALMMCSLNCLTLYQVSVNAVSAKRISCDFCKEYSQAQYHLTMSDATIRNFCSYNCVMKFQGQYTKSPITIPSSDDPVPTGMPKRTYPIQAAGSKPSEIGSSKNKAMPVISSVTSLAASLTTSNGQVVTGQPAQPPHHQQLPSTTTTTNSSSSSSSNTTVVNNTTSGNVVASTQSQTPQVIVNQQVITRPPSPVKIHNKVTQCKPLVHTKGVSVRPHPCTKSTQTDNESRLFIPVPVPIYVPFPVHMWSMPFPIPIPFPLPIPVPVFVPTTRNSAKGIFKDIKRIQEKIPADPFEAELLMMAEMVATDKKANETDSDSSDDNGREASETTVVDSSNTFGEDMLQMALKMATGELDEPAVDLETALTPNTITATQTSQSDSAVNTDVQPERNATASNRGKKRMVPYKPRGGPSKRGRRISAGGGVVHDAPIMPPLESQAQSQPRIMEPIEKPDANMALKYTFGVNAWRQWVIAKNTELEKQMTPTRKVKLFKTDLLQLTADELNYTLCLFVKEVRKPNGAEYAPDTIYYLCLGIQQYLFENNRIDNIFTDSYYEKFTDCLNEVAKKFSVLYNDAQYIVTRVEEEHLWECKQLGAHSPHVLLSTLMFFNTKHFNLVTVEEHMQLSFSHIMKHWKRNPAAQATGAPVPGKGPGTRNVLLRFYPPQSALEANSRKKKVYEQQENEDNPLRCPVKLYEFYLSKCPESVKTRNDVFYLLPERSCVPDSPVWYSTSALAKEHLVKMLYRVKMVKEINVALLTS